MAASTNIFEFKVIVIRWYSSSFQYAVMEMVCFQIIQIMVFINALQMSEWLLIVKLESRSFDSLH